MPTTSRQPRTQTDKDVNPFFIWTMFEHEDSIPAWGSQGRGEKLREFARQEPILAGAVATMSGKATALDWKVEGGRNRVRRYHDLLGEAEDGQGWSYFLDRLVQDYVATDLGGVIELGRDGKGGPVAGIFNLDSTACSLTGNAQAPVKYSPKVGNSRTIALLPGEYARVVDMPSNDESKFGLGFCAVSRALKAAKVLMALYQYEEEQLNDLPPQGIASITGMTAPEVKQAFDLYQAKREAKEQMTFKGVLWLAATANALQPIDVKLTPFANLPDHFDKEKAMTLYVYTLALDFGVDVREFWPASQTGATKAEAEIQHQKAKGKGFGRLLSDVERAVNWEVLPDGLSFAFDQQDSEDDLLRQQVHKESVELVRRLWEPVMTGDGIITTAEARRWLVEQGVLPEWLAGTVDVTSYGSENDVAAEGEGEPAPLRQAQDVAATVEAVAQKAARARLGPGEDLVRVNRAGEMRTLWTSKRVYAIPLPVGYGRRSGTTGEWTEMDRDGHGQGEASTARPFVVGRGAPYP